mmetsp:Transcript_11135/g.25789  ORF Transcript_11135/g.25789 Transcript_11135/m.25789 type:complete len:195 (+) Transcript_11135:111-695(+)|eukprot:CAMPEP_0116841190 /NCGR_PEP_ID=MMETSP0418-20121206/10786_1 /TAXON_ID=1158023 /ORGANISM="Astrosyne radiata, Strain 13vi08-1A" /LENGTH=194 /DNA_ID=CAMNT_0004471587 /DNA_START=55 /DNA_END=639 /DNA_ORIENTATION=-
MVRYSVEPDVPEKTSKARGSHLRVHYKHCREIARVTHGMRVDKALVFCDRVLRFETTVTFSRHTGGIGHHAQAKQHRAPGNAGRWPVKAMQVYKDLLTNALANAEAKFGAEAEKLIISHAQVNRAPPGRRRTYRAHGRIGKYASQPAHMEIILTEVRDAVEKQDEEDEVEVKPIKISKKMAAMRRFVKVGGGTD